MNPTEPEKHILQKSKDQAAREKDFRDWGSAYARSNSFELQILNDRVSELMYEAGKREREVQVNNLIKMRDAANDEVARLRELETVIIASEHRAELNFWKTEAETYRNAIDEIINNYTTPSTVLRLAKDALNSNP